MPRLVSDLVRVLHAIYVRPPPLLLVGHSLGGALAVHLAHSKQLPVCGVVMVDLVEGSAVASLGHMRQVLEARPEAFQNPEAAVAWSLRAGALRNVQSARLSMPDQLIRCEGEEGGTQSGNKELNNRQEAGQVAETEAVLASVSTSATASSAASSSHSPSSSPSPLSSSSTPYYRWRTNLFSSEPYWSDWFAGLSGLFLSIPLPKLLLLASAERLDPPLMVAQMQGKLQVDVVSDCGHSVQEDQPADTARRILTFVHRHKMMSMGKEWAKNFQRAAPTEQAMANLNATYAAVRPTVKSGAVASSTT